MFPSDAPAISLRPWRMTDAELLSALNTPVMTAHTGGPESSQKLSQRLQRYAEPRGDAEMFVIEDPSGQPLGSIGYWRREWQGEQVYETGWAVLPEFQGRGIASEAARLVIQRAAAAGGAVALHAYPRVDHPASNATCRKAGFQLVGVVDFEYPPEIRSGQMTGLLTSRAGADPTKMWDCPTSSSATRNAAGTRAASPGRSPALDLGEPESAAEETAGRQ